MRSFTIAVFTTVLLGLILTLSHFLSGRIKGRIEERFLLPEKMYLLFVPEDLHYGLADMGFINTLSFIGYSLQKEKGILKREDALMVYSALDAVTFYNPSYFDPYYVGNAFLTWNVGLYQETVDLLKRGLKYIKDWRIPFYIGFNYFYFLKDNLKGAEYLRLAAKYPGAKEYNLLPLLASKLYYEEGQLDVAIALLKEQLKLMKEEKMKELLRARLETLKKAKTIYRAMKIFKKRFGRKPKSVEELVRAKLIPPNLRDSRGGKFFITSDGKVRSEKDLMPVVRKLLEEE